jgi:hypothetical protein
MGNSPSSADATTPPTAAIQSEDTSFLRQIETTINALQDVRKLSTRLGYFLSGFV